MEVISLALFLVATSLSAQAVFPLDRMDSDGDGELTRSELGNKGARILERFDSNKDGKLGSDELEKARSSWKQKSATGGEEPEQSSSRSSGRSSGGGRGGNFQNFTSTKPLPGDPAPAFELKTLDGEPASLATLASKRPVVIEFGSFT
ncbi:MAG: hypothetical protein O3B01_09150 [Planctomycetota bacterium]|nr:hypothetical protein [Planctomycetota bacterium]